MENNRVNIPPFSTREQKEHVSLKGTESETARFVFACKRRLDISQVRTMNYEGPFW